MILHLSIYPYPSPEVRGLSNIAGTPPDLSLHASVQCFTYDTSRFASALGADKCRPAWSVKTPACYRRTHRPCRGARVYGHTATAMHDNIHEYPHRRANELIEPVIHTLENPPQQRFLSGMQATLHATRRAPHGAFAPGAGNAGENPTCSVPEM